ncbi:MAG: hypothetical protein U1F65_07330 [Verrucomicrobiota bacterium]
MKKLITIITLAILLTASSFGQGYFALSSGSARAAWDIFSNPQDPTPKFGSNIFINIFWAEGVHTHALQSLFNGTPTNHVISLNANPWSMIQSELSSGVWHLAVDANTGNVIQPRTLSNSGWAYTTTGGFSMAPVAGTNPNTSYSMMVIGFDASYGTLADAYYSGSLGWSKVFNYDAVTEIDVQISLNKSGFAPFGVSFFVPEPNALTILGLTIPWFLAKRRRSAR